MGQMDITQLMAIAGVLLGVVGIICALLLYRRMKAMQRNQRVVMGAQGRKDLVSHVLGLEAKVNNIREAMEDLALSVKDHEARIDSCLSGVGMVRFNAYEDLGGQQSTTVAFLNAGEDGVVVTTVVSREFARMYVKSIRNGSSDVPLAPEEAEAVEKAREHGNKPFTLRPRQRDTGTEDVDTTDVPWDDTGEYMPAPEVPASLGWPKLEPPQESELDNQAAEEEQPQSEEQDRGLGYAPSHPGDK